MPNLRSFLFLVAVPALFACNLPFEVPARERDRALQTEGLEYELRGTDRGVEVDIPFTYTNETGRTVYVVNCNNIVPPSLEKQVGGDWIPAWSSIVPLCLSPPIVIEPGGTYSDTLQVFGGHDSNNTYPKFEVDEVDGIYRLVWHNVVHDYDDDRQDFGDPLALADRISNTFLLREE